MKVTSPEDNFVIENTSTRVSNHLGKIGNLSSEENQFHRLARRKNRIGLITIRNLNVREFAEPAFKPPRLRSCPTSQEICLRNEPDKPILSQTVFHENECLPCPSLTKLFACEPFYNAPVSAAPRYTARWRMVP